MYVKQATILPLAIFCISLISFTTSHPTPDSVVTDIMSDITEVPNILIATGEITLFEYTEFSPASEIINLANEHVACSNLKKYPFKVWGAVGSNLGKTPVICGGVGDFSDRCYGYVKNEWKEFANMTNSRSTAAAIVYQNSLHIFGGRGRGQVLQSTEIINENGTATASVNLPIPLWEHAIASVNDERSIITGGRTGRTRNGSNLTWYFDHFTQEFKQGPNLLQGRKFHGAGTIIDSGTNQKIPVVAGGNSRGDTEVLDSTEFLIDGEWQQGPALPKAISGYSMVNYNGDLYAIGGAHGELSFEKAIYKLTCSHGDCQWKTIDLELKETRAVFVAIPVMDSHVDCISN